MLAAFRALCDFPVSLDSASGAGQPLPRLGYPQFLNYPVGPQLRWLLGAFAKASVPAAELKAHFDAKFLAVAPPATLNADLAALHLRAPLRVTYLDAGLTASALEGGLASGTTEYSFIMYVDSRGLISGLRLGPSPALPAAPTSWAALTPSCAPSRPASGFSLRPLPLLRPEAWEAPATSSTRFRPRQRDRSGRC